MLRLKKLAIPVILFVLFAAAAHGSPTLAATPRVAPTPPYANGDTFTYAITDTTVVTNPGQPPSTSTQTAFVAESVAYPVTFGSRKNVYAISSTVQDTSNSTRYAEHIGYFETAYAGFFPKGRIYQLAYLGYGTQSLPSEFISTTIGLKYSSPYNVVAEYPESNGLSWANNYKTVYDNYASTEFGPFYSISSTTLPSGAYVEKISTYPDQQTVTQTFDERADATGTLDNSQNGNNPPQHFIFEAPADRNNAEVIPVKLNGTLGYVPDWYPGGAAPPSPLQQYGDAISSTTTPQACGAQSGQGAYDVRQTGYALDILGGTYTTQTTDAYDSATQGMICSVAVITVTAYDNFITGQLLATTVETNVEILTGEQSGQPRAHAHGLAPLRPIRFRLN